MWFSLGTEFGASAGVWRLRATDDTPLGAVSRSVGLPPARLGDPNCPVAQSGLLNGMHLPYGFVPVDRPGTVRFACVAGPCAGSIVPLAHGAENTIGRSPQAHVSVADPTLREHHAVIVLTDADPHTGPTARLTLGSGAEGWHNGVDITDSVTLTSTDHVQLGAHVFCLGVAPASDADIATTSCGTRSFNRPSRIRMATQPPRVTLPPEAPRDREEHAVPWVVALLPALLGIASALLYGRPELLVLALASPLLVLVSGAVQRRRTRARGAHTRVDWECEVAAVRTRLRALADEQRVAAWHSLPDPVTLTDIATRPLTRLWERRSGDADAALLRVGVAEIPLVATYEGTSAPPNGGAFGVSPAPVAADLRDGPVGVAGPRDTACALVRSMIAGWIVLRSPRDTALVVLCDDDARRDWEWVQWVPHAHPPEGDDTADAHAAARAGRAPAVLLGNTEDTRRDRVRELLAEYDARRRAIDAGSGSSARPGAATGRDILIVLDGARSLRVLPGMARLLGHGAEVGMFVLALDCDLARLSEECASVVVADPDDLAFGRLDTERACRDPVLLDGMAPGCMDQIARALCSLRHVSGVGDAATLPSSVRLADLLRVDLRDASVSARLCAQWQHQPSNLTAVIGATADGAFALDLARDGPHALVAGTTGSGKSEWLQAFVVSLAWVNRPDALQCVLIDYKGGAAFAACADLPHTVGMVTNLDARETERALTALDAELRRREQILRDAGVGDLDNLWATDPNRASRDRLPRLVIVIDEFAELRAELPAFVDGLVRVARVGRSLGVHLVLATQRPSGVVTADMQANMGVRIALRVTDHAESMDVLGSPIAATIRPDTPGRGYLRTASGTAPIAFHTARVAGVRDDRNLGVSPAPQAAALRWETLGCPLRWPGASGPQPAADRDTDLRLLVARVRAAADLLALPAARPPWLPPLPAVLPLERVTAEALEDGAVVLGLADLPGEQAQRPLLWQVARDGHLLFIGGARSGRTSVLRTLAVQLIQRFAPNDLHLYVLDFGAGALLPFADAPHTGAIITAHDTRRIARFTAALLADLTRRQQCLAAAGVGSCAEQRAGVDVQHRLAYAVLLIDGWERLTASLSPEAHASFRDDLLRVLREGPAAGVRVVLTGDRSLATDRVAAYIDRHLVLPLRDVQEYRISGITGSAPPASLPPGRALLSPSGDEVQLAIVSPDPSGTAQQAACRAAVDRVTAHCARFPWLAALSQPLRVDPVPASVSAAELTDFPVAEGCNAAGATVAVGGDTLARYTLDWPAEGGFVVVGDRRSGRSTVLALLVSQLAAAGHPLLVVAGGHSPLIDTANAWRVPVLAPEATPFEVAETLRVIPTPTHPLTVLVDDAEAVKQRPAETAVLDSGRTCLVIAATDAEGAMAFFSGYFALARRARRALVLRPDAVVLGAQLAGAPIPRAYLERGTPGSGVLTGPHGWVPVRVPDVYDRPDATVPLAAQPAVQSRVPLVRPRVQSAADPSVRRAPMVRAAPERETTRSVGGAP